MAEWRRDFAGLTWTGFVWGDSEIFGEQMGQMQRFDAATGLATVRWHLEDDHPAVQDCLADNPGMATDQMEWIDLLPLSALRDQLGDPIPEP